MTEFLYLSLLSWGDFRNMCCMLQGVLYVGLKSFNIWKMTSYVLNKMCIFWRDKHLFFTFLPLVSSYLCSVVERAVCPAFLADQRKLWNISILCLVQSVLHGFCVINYSFCILWYADWHNECVVNAEFNDRYCHLRHFYIYKVEYLFCGLKLLFFWSALLYCILEHCLLLCVCQHE